MSKIIGILALQGDFAAHSVMLKHLNVEPRLIKLPQQLASLDGLIIPGGESTTISKQITSNQAWLTAFADIHKKRLPIFSTCAGLILISKQIRPNQFSLGWLDIIVQRNGYGRQINSHFSKAAFTVHGREKIIEIPLIRAPKIISIGAEVIPLVQEQQQIYLVEQQHLLAATFHPELTKQTDIHSYFLEKVDKYKFTRDD